MADFPVTRASLLVRLRDPRDETAWRDFVHLYAPLVYGYARKQGLQEADAADLCQEVLGAVAGAIRRLEYDPRRGAFRNWLFTIVRRRLCDWRAAPANRLLGSGDTAVQHVLEQTPAPGGMEADWQAEWEERLVLWACEEARRHVSEGTWQAFWRTAVEGQPGKQVAADLGLTVAAVYHARSRVVARLRELIQAAQESE
jgi:RNA polymerase sigma-70 factor (ECF subfamily)